jgi:hypothetical protein
MSRKKEMVGKRFGRLVVEKEAALRGPFGVIRWHCICDCGKTLVVKGESLRIGSTKSCGCYQKEQAAYSCRRLTRSHRGITQTVEYRMWSSAKHRAKVGQLPFDLEPFDIHVPDFCPVMGIPLQRGVGKVCRASPVLDKLDPAKGYVRDNVWVISNFANLWKRDFTLSQLQEFVRRIKLFSEGGHGR